MEKLEKNVKKSTKSRRDEERNHKKGSRRARTCKSRAGRNVERARRFLNVQRIKDVQQKRTTVKKFEKNFKKSSERKKERQSQEETRKVSTNMVLDVADVCSTCKRCI